MKTSVLTIRERVSMLSPTVFVITVFLSDGVMGLSKLCYLPNDIASPYDVTTNTECGTLCALLTDCSAFQVCQSNSVCAAYEIDSAATLGSCNDSASHFKCAYFKQETYQPYDESSTQSESTTPTSTVDPCENNIYCE